ncbi:hypothetical protein SASPL_101060 [Salvia splendens]|uniref:Uncharacterized protein n=1 Tax=Salvia splendens TaxID=180675 RepID=A0A8X8YU45_SALSN|nr:hypothetical protein SASPL_101060 [Salvia splendens]
MAEQPRKQHRLHEVPPVAANPDRHRRHGGVAGGHRGRLHSGLARVYAACGTSSTDCMKLLRLARRPGFLSRLLGQDQRLHSGLAHTDSGCCKPPTSCGYTYMNETFWITGGGLTGTDPDCAQWSNELHMLCYSCGSCKAGVLASLKTSWRRVSITNVIILIILVLVYVVALAGVRHNKQLDDPHGETPYAESSP